MSPARVTELRLLAEQGLTQAEAARQIGVSNPAVSLAARKHGIIFQRRKPWSKPIHQEIRRMFMAGSTPRQIAEALDRPYDTIVVTLCRMGLTKNRRPDPGRYRRPYDVPDHLFGQYKELRRLGLTMIEVGYELGLLSREPSKERAA